MSAAAIIMMIIVQGTVIGITAYFFYKVLTAKPRPEPDSYADNDDETRDQ